MVLLLTLSPQSFALAFPAAHLSENDLHVRSANLCAAFTAHEYVVEMASVCLRELNHGITSLRRFDLLYDFIT